MEGLNLLVMFLEHPVLTGLPLLGFVLGMIVGGLFDGLLVGALIGAIVGLAAGLAFEIRSIVRRSKG